MTRALLVSKGFIKEFGASFHNTAREGGSEARFVCLPESRSLSDEEVAEIEAAYLTRDIRFSPLYPAFCDAVASAPKLKWVHFVSAALDQYPFLDALEARGVRLTTSSGTNADPVANTAITGLLMLGRNFPKWLDARARRAWEPMRGKETPRDLAGQTVAVIGIGHIGAIIARFCQALRMNVIGVRRSPLKPGDPVDEMHTLAELPLVLPRCDFVVLACPYTPDTHHLLNEKTIAMLPRGAKVVNIGRGLLIDEPALIRALKNGHIHSAFLDVFETEPLPSDSPIWDMPNVIMSPHNASASAGNDARTAELFAANYVKFVRGERMLNEQ